MALTTAQIQAILTQLYTVRSTKAGVAMVQFEGRTIRYEAGDKIDEAIRYWEGRLSRANGSRPRVMQQDCRNF